MELSNNLISTTSKPKSFFRSLILHDNHPMRGGILAWRVSRTEEPRAYSPSSYKESDRTEWLSTHIFVFFVKAFRKIFSTFLQNLVWSQLFIICFHRSKTFLWSNQNYIPVIVQVWMACQTAEMLRLCFNWNQHTAPPILKCSWNVRFRGHKT